MFQTDKCGGRGKPLKNINFGKISISYLFYLPETFIFLGAFYDFIFGLEFSGHWRIFKVLQEQRSFSCDALSARCAATHVKLKTLIFWTCHHWEFSRNHYPTVQEYRTKELPVLSSPCVSATQLFIVGNTQESTFSSNLCV